MNSLILQTSTRVLMSVVIIFSVFMLLRGHDHPGGGFIAGLLITGAFALHLLAFGNRKTRDLMRIDLRNLIGIGLLCSLVSGLWGVLRGFPFLTGQWLEQEVPGIGKIGSVLLFDLGVYFVVFGSLMLILMTLGRDD